MAETLLPESTTGGGAENSFWVEPGAVQEIPADTRFERPMDSGLFVNEVRTPEEEAALDEAFGALERREETA